MEPAKREYSVAKRPLMGVPAERRAEIAQELLDAYKAGVEIAEIAPQYSISDVTAYALLLRDHEEEWKAAQGARALARKATADADLDAIRQELDEFKQDQADPEKRAALDPLSLARIREQVKLAEVRAKRAEWELERVCRRIYGQDHGVTINIDSDWGERLRRAKQRTSNTDADVIDVTPLNPQE